MSAFSAWWRRMSGHENGAAKELVVFGNPGFQDPKKVNELMFAHHAVSQWASERGLELSDQPDALVTLDAVLTQWSKDSVIAPDLANEVGVFLGNMIVRDAPRARWTVMLSGHPVVGLASGREVDVTALVGDRLLTGASSLHDIYSNALSSEGEGSASSR